MGLHDLLSDILAVEGAAVLVAALVFPLIGAIGLGLGVLVDRVLK